MNDASAPVSDSAEDPVPDEVTPEEPTTDEQESAEPGRPPGRLRRLLNRIPVPRPQTRGGALLLILAVLGVGVVVTLGGVQLVEYSESVPFCTLCHTMVPEKKAFEASAHTGISCADCHVAPGPIGFISAKLAGTRELYALVTNTYPTPIPPIEHKLLPTTQQTCQECHSLEKIGKSGGPSQLVVRTTFADDEKNTRKDIAVLLRPAELGTPDAVGVHWHVEQPVTYTSGDEHLQKIDSVEFKDRKTGELKQYVAVSQVRQSSNAAADLARLKATQEVRTMDCIDCHNRVGHPVPPADKAIDEAMAAGTIDPSLPYVKRTAMALINKPYATSAAGEAAINGLGSFYEAQYPLVAKDKAPQIVTASQEIKRIFELIVTPEMKAGNGTYADNLGHQSSPGCFRCHDGAHYRVVDNVVTTETIPSTCDTCHTFPQITGGQGVVQDGKTAGVTSSVPVGARPGDHNDSLWVFNHRNVAGSTSANPNTCGACHQTSYCETCHNSGAVKVDHYMMLYNHAESVRQAGGATACAVCHQPAYCDQCHKNPVLGPSNSRLDKPGG